MMVRTKIFVKEDTKMLYTDKEKHEIERVKEVFEDCLLYTSLADAAGHEVAWFSKAWHNGLPLAAALFTVHEAVCRV